MDYEPKISVIVPVYNAMPYLESCMESLLSQSVADNIEVICVDDRGTDESVVFIEKLMASHIRGKQIRLLHMPHNSGASRARNYGLLQARGEYVGFVDADDWCETDMYERLLSAVGEEQADWGYCLAKKEFENGHSQLLSQPVIKSGPLSDADRRTMLRSGVAYFWTGLYNRHFLLANAIDFPDGKFSEDSYFWWLSVMHADRIAMLDEVGYHYVIQGNSVSKRPDPTKAEQKQRMYSALVSRLRSESLYSRFAEEIDFMYIKKGLLIPLMIKAINHPDTPSSYYHQMIAEAREDRVDIDGNDDLRRNLRLRLLLFGFRYMPKVVSLLLRLRYKTDPF